MSYTGVHEPPSGTSKSPPAGSLADPPPHPAVWMVLFLPVGATAGFVAVTIAYIAKQQGLGDATIAGFVAFYILPQAFKFLWAPILDTTFSRRGWYVAATVVSTLTLIALGLMPIRGDTRRALEGLILANSVAITFLAMAVEGLLANVVTEAQRGSAAGWLQMGNLGGAGVGGGLALWLAQRIGSSGAFVLLAVALLACALGLLPVHEPKRPAHESLAGALLGVVRDVWQTIVRSRTGLLALILCFLPVGSAAASNLFAAMADRWRTSADAVALYTGLLGGLVAAVGCMVGGWLSDQMDRKMAYALTGVFLAVTAIGMYVGPPTEAGYRTFTLTYQFGSGLAYGAFTAFVLEAIGRGAAATKYNILGSLANIPIWYMTQIDGWTSERWGARRMLLVDAASEVVGVLLFLLAAYLLLNRSQSPRTGTDSSSA